MRSYRRLVASTLAVGMLSLVQFGCEREVNETETTTEEIRVEDEDTAVTPATDTDIDIEATPATDLGTAPDTGQTTPAF